MKLTQIFSPPSRNSGASSFQKLYDEISRDWEVKAEALQARRWHKLSMSLHRHI